MAPKRNFMETSYGRAASGQFERSADTLNGYVRMRFSVALSSVVSIQSLKLPRGPDLWNAQREPVGVDKSTGASPALCPITTVFALGEAASLLSC